MLHALSLLLAFHGSALAAPSEDPLPTLQRAMDHVLPALATQQDPLLHLAYTVTEHRTRNLTAREGALAPLRDQRDRTLDIDLRVGDMKVDNTHKLRDSWSGSYRADGTSPRDEAGDALFDLAVLGTDDTFRAARKRLVEVRANDQVKVAREDDSDDFSPTPVVTHLAPPAPVELDLKSWEARVQRASTRIAAAEHVHQSGVELAIDEERRWLLTRDGTRIADGRTRLRVSAWAETTADDGMRLQTYDYVDVAVGEHLPDEAAFDALVDGVVRNLQALRRAPIVDPFEGPAILRGRAASVFFHEIFGHRIEGHRQKDEDEGQTFTKRVGLPVLPDFLSVVDDPTLASLAGRDLNGNYAYDDEGVAAQRVTLVDKGVLRGFLMSRAPIKGFGTSNGHGRREPGNDVVPRQGNLIVEASRTVPYAKLREQLVAEVKRQGKPFGLVFDDISGGFTFTGRSTPNAFAVQPVTVWRVFPDGRPDELVRGVDLIGTPLTTFGRILAAGDDRDVFNGMCGAESGWVPVSGSSPSLLVQSVEVQRTEKGNDRPPLLAPPVTVVTAGGAK